MDICIIGGSFRGMECAYLAKKAGYGVTVIDRDDSAPARTMADRFYAMDPLKNPASAKALFSGAGAVVPATGNIELLREMDRVFKGIDTPLLFDVAAYSAAASKTISRRLLDGIGIPAPAMWPECGFPAVVKPMDSHSRIPTSVVNTLDELRSIDEHIVLAGDDSFIQECVPGTKMVTCVIGNGERTLPCISGELEVDDGFDKKRVRCDPTINSRPAAAKLSKLARDIAEAMSVVGPLFVEGTEIQDEAVILDIDACVVSMMPTAILHSTGFNLLEVLMAARVKDINPVAPRVKRATICEHILVTDDRLRFCGNREFSRISCPRIHEGLFGSTEIITDYAPGLRTWRATLVTTGSDMGDAERKRAECIENIVSECGITLIEDPKPRIGTSN